MTPDEQQDEQFYRDTESIAFPKLDDRQLSLLEPLGERRVLKHGHLAYKAGQRDLGLTVVLRGEIEAFEQRDGTEQILATARERDFMGDVAMLQVGDFGTRLASLASGTVQGSLLLPPFTLRAKELGLRPLYDLVGSGIQYPINQITTRQSFIKSQRETVKNFLKGLVAGLARFRTDREFGVKVLGKNLHETDGKILQETYDFWLKVFPKIPNPGPEDATVFLEFMQVKEQRDWKDFVDTSLMDELEREGFLSSIYR